MLTQEELKLLFHYNTDTGTLTKIKSGREIKLAKGANYLQLELKTKRYYAHKLIWFYMTGEWAKNQVDHKDTNKINNKWNNLREATVSQNQFNTKHRRQNKLGVKGVEKRKYGFRARIRVNGNKIELGTFKTLEEAKFAYLEKAKEFHKEFIHNSLIETNPDF